MNHFCLIFNLKLFLKFETPTTNCRFKINQSKSIHMEFTLKPTPCPDVFIYDTQISSTLNIKYFRLTIDKRLNLVHLIKSKRLSLNLRLHPLKNLIINNKHIRQYLTSYL